MGAARRKKFFLGGRSIQSWVAGLAAGAGGQADRPGLCLFFTTRPARGTCLQRGTKALYNWEMDGKSLFRRHARGEPRTTSRPSGLHNWEMDQLPAVNAALPYEDLGRLRDVATLSVADKVSMISHASFWPPLNFDFPLGDFDGKKRRKCNASYEAKFPSFGYSIQRQPY